MIVNDLLGVLYAPHKTFKKIIENPKYLGVAIVLILFIAVQTGYYFSYYSRVNFEQTAPTTDQLTAWTDTNSTLWTTTQGANVSRNTVDFLNQTFFGNNSLQFDLTNSNSLSATLNPFNFAVDAGPNGFRNLSLNFRQVSPNVAPQNALLTLYTSNGTSSYFTYDLTSQLSSNVGQWNNLTIPVGTSDWQTTGSANWSDVTGIKLDLTYPSASDISVRLDGLFFRGYYSTQVNSLGGLSFAGLAAYSVVIQTLFQWIILTAISYLILKGLKAANVVWRPLFIAMGYVFMALIVTSLIALVATLALPTVYYPYDFPPYASLVYPASWVSATSAASQATYNSILSSTTLFTGISTAVTIVMYIWEAALVTFIVRSLTGISWVKSIATAAGAVILTIVILSLLSSIGLI